MSSNREGVREAGFVRTTLDVDPLASDDALIVSLWVRPEARALVETNGPEGPSERTELEGGTAGGDTPNDLRNAKKAGRPRADDPLVTTAVRLKRSQRAFCDAHGGPALVIRQLIDTAMVRGL